MNLTIAILPTTDGPAGKLADVEVHFVDAPLAGLLLKGFAVWRRREGEGYNVTVPSRPYSVNGERRNFALLREGPRGSLEPLRALIVAAYEQHVGAAERAS